MLPARLPRFPRVRLRPRRRNHQPRSRPPALRLAMVASAVVLAIGAIVAAHTLAAARPAGARHRQTEPPVVVHIPPVDAPIGDAFRPPAGPYGAGNRGLEYDTAPGTPVAASAAGTVSFAGAVGGSLHVTVLHADGVRTSYSFLAAIEVVRGQPVAQGDRVGTAGESLHFGARIGDDYFDPAALFTGTVTDVELLPFEVPPGSTPAAEARALASIALAEGGGLSLPGAGAIVEWLSERARTGLHYAGAANQGLRSLGVARDIVDRVLFPPPCSTGPPPVRPAAPGDRVAVTVGGLGSTSASASIDELELADLGYAPARVVRFSYAGGRTPGTGSGLAGIPARRYASADTQGDVAIAAGRLADLIERTAAAAPAAAVDVYAHSLGGLVARLALDELHERGFDLGRLGLVTTLGAPHHGADLATAVAAANTRPLHNVGLDLVEGVLDTGLDPDAPVVRQLGEHSAVVAGLAARGVPQGVRLLSIAARGDLIVPAPRSEVTGATNVILPLSGLEAHGAVAGSDATMAEVARALAGRPPGCESTADALADVLTGHAISMAEDAVGAASWASG